jgi:hypothetical protein
MDRETAREAVETLQNLLISRATGGGGNDREYRDLREWITGDPELRDLVPRFVRTSRDLSQFWAYIQKQRSGYRERREYLWQAFDPLLRYLETGAPPAQPSRLGEAISASGSLAPKVRAFLSYSSTDKQAAAAVKKALSTLGIECFLAHDDIKVSEPWKERILEELGVCDVFIPLLSDAFKKSDFAPQEVGVAAQRRDLAILPLSLDGTIPYGFISHIQSGKVPAGGVEPDTILEPLTRRFPRVVIPAMIERVRGAPTFRAAEAAMRPLVPHFANLTADELDALVTASIHNNQVWSAALCRDEYLPDLIELNRRRIRPEELRILEYQIENDEWYPGGDE